MSLSPPCRQVALLRTRVAGGHLCVSFCCIHLVVRHPPSACRQVPLLREMDEKTLYLLASKMTPFRWVQKHQGHAPRCACLPAGAQRLAPLAAGMQHAAMQGACQAVRLDIRAFASNAKAPRLLSSLAC